MLSVALPGAQVPVSLLCTLTAARRSASSGLHQDPRPVHFCTQASITGNAGALRSQRKGPAEEPGPWWKCTLTSSVAPCWISLLEFPEKGLTSKKNACSRTRSEGRSSQSWNEPSTGRWRGRLLVSFPCASVWCVSSPSPWVTCAIPCPSKLSDSRQDARPRAAGFPTKPA